MSHIVIDARELRTTSGRYIERLLHYLQKIDDQHDYTVLLTSKDIDEWEPTNPRFHKVETSYKEFTFGEQLGFLKQINSLKADLVFFPFVQQPIGYRGKIVTTIQDLTTLRFYNPAKNKLVFTVKQKIYGQVIKHAVRHSDRVITPTKFVRDDVIAYTKANPAKFVVTYEAADAITDKATPIKALKGRQFIMYVGRPQPHKNLSRLIDAFGILKESHPKLTLVLAGKKETLFDRHEQEVANKGIADVIFTDFVSEGELRWLYENTAAYIFPTLSEGFGLPGLEAALAGAPVVASNASCIPEVYGKGAHYFDPLDVPDMARQISKVLDDASFRATLASAGLKQAQKYSWERMAQQTLDVFNTTLDA